MAKSKDALTSIDDYGHRIEIIPAEVQGFFRRWKNRVYAILLLVFLGLPWTKINGSQTLLFDIVQRKFSLFGVLFWSHDSPLLFFVLMFVVIGIALATALWGRIWCGWACPQTVFIDGIYRRIEILVEGNYIQRRQLQKAPFDLNKMKKWILKWLLFGVVSSIIAHSFMAYFIGSEVLLEMMKQGPIQNWHYFLLLSATTLFLLFNFGWFREQFCIVVCPYGRFQSVLMDSNSVTVLYDEIRGEPRKGSAALMPISEQRTVLSTDIQPIKNKQGDCVSCRRCVEVCPTGIDIRQGVQMECIGCTACMDACDEVMKKINKPPRLIRYASLYPKTRFFRPRIVIYSLLLVVLATGLGLNFIGRSDYVIDVFRAAETPYQILKIDNQIRVLNHFKLHIHNQSQQEQKFLLSLPQEWVTAGFQLTTQSDSFVLPAASNKEVHFFIFASHDVFNKNGKFPIFIQIKNQIKNNFEVVKKEIILVGPLHIQNNQSVELEKASPLKTGGPFGN